MGMVLAAALLLAQSPITLQTEATPLRQLMPKLAQATGLPLAVSPEVEWQVVYVRVKDAAPADLLRHIAKVSFGAWETTSDGRQLLKRDAAAFSRLADERRKNSLTALQEAIKETFDPKNQSGASEKALARIAQQIGLNNLASIGETQRVVYSTNPTQMQKSLGGVSPAFFEEMILEHNKGVDKQTARGSLEVDDEEMKKFESQLPPEYLKLMKDMEESMRPKRINGMPAKIDIAFTNQYGVGASLKMYDAQGNELASFDTSFGGGGVDEDLAAVSGVARGTATVVDGSFQTTAKSDQEEKQEPDKSPVLKLSKDATEILALTYFDETGGFIGAGKTSDGVKARILAIGSKDPFLAAQTEVLDGYAANVKENLVIRVPDHLMDYRESKQITVNAVDTELGLDKKDGWGVSPADEFEPRVNRDTLALAIDKIKNGGEMTIDDKAWLAGNEDRLGGLNNRLMDKIYRAFRINSYLWRGRPLLKLYGTMNQSQRTAATGNGIPISSLNNEQRRMVEQICYGPELYVKPIGGMDDFDEEMMFTMDFEEAMKRQFEMMKSGDQDYLKEPTESMPRGVPANAIVLLSRKSDTAYLPVSKTQDEGMLSFMGEMGGLTIDMLAGMMSFGNMMDQPEVQSQMPTHVKNATRDSLELKLRCTDKVGYTERHRASKASSDGKTIKISDLPGFTELLAKRKEQLKKWMPMFSMGMGMGRRGSPPPQ